MAPTQRVTQFRGSEPLSPTAPYSGRQAFLASQGKLLLQVIRSGAMQQAALLAQRLSIEIRAGYDPLNKRAFSAVQVASALEKSLRRMDQGGAARFSKNLQSEAIPLIRTLERMAKEMDEAIGLLGPCLACGEAEKASALSRSIIRTVKLFQDQNVERIRRLGPKMDKLVAAVSADPKEAALLLALTVQHREVLSLQDAANANKVLVCGRQLLQALRQKRRGKVERVSVELESLAAAFLETLKERANHLSDHLKPIRSALGKHPLELIPLFDAVRALGIPEDLQQALAEALLHLYRASRDRAEDRAERFEELSRCIEGIGKESSRRLDALKTALKKLKEEGKLIAFLQDRSFRNTKAYWERYEVLARMPEAKGESGIAGLLKRGTDFFAG